MRKYLELILVILLALAWLATSGCKRCDCWGGTYESKDQDYKGSATATEPYHVVNTKLWEIPAKGTGGVFATVTVWLHNPTSAPTKTDVTCKLVRTSAGAPGVTEEHTAGKNTRKGVAVKARSSKKVELQFNLDFSPTQHGYEPVCSTSFGSP